MKVCVKRKLENGVSFEFVDGTMLEAGLDGLGEETLKQLALHGLSQKIGDSYAGSASVSEAVEAAKGVYGNLQAGIWATKSSTGGRIVEALVRATGRTHEECLQLWTSAGKEEQKALRAHPDVKIALADMEVERVKGLKGGGRDLNELFS